jgi:hypothetical protein
MASIWREITSQCAARANLFVCAKRLGSPLRLRRRHQPALVALAQREARTLYDEDPACRCRSPLLRSGRHVRAVSGPELNQPGLVDP